MEIYKLDFISFLALFFCLMVLGSSSAWSLNERIPSTPNTQMLSRKPKSFVLLPRLGRRNKFMKLIYLKHLLQLNCLSEICRKMHSKPFEQQKPETVNKQVFGFRNNSSKLYDQSLLLSSMRQNKFKNPISRRRYPANDRIILLPSNYYLNQPTSQRNSSFPGGPRGKERPTNQHKEKIIYLRWPLQNEGNRTPGEKLIIQNKKVFANNGPVSKAETSPVDQFQLPEGFYITKPTTAATNSFKIEETPNSLPQYEVREFIEENVTNNYINFRNSTTRKPVAVNTSKVNMEKNIMKNMTAPKPNIKVNATATTPSIKIATTHRSRDFFEKSGKVQLQVNSEELTKHLRVRPSQSSNNWKPSTTAPRKTDNKNVNTGYKTSADLENFGGVAHNPLDSFIADYFTQADFYDDVEPKATTLQKYDSHELFPFTTRRLITNIIPKQASMTISKQPPTSSVIPTEIQTTKTTVMEYLTTKPVDLYEQLKDSGNDRMNTSTPSNAAKTVQFFAETINEAELTTPDFEEYLDHPLIFDLLKTIITDSKKDHEKNSRKMHFGQDSRKTTKPMLFNQLSDPDEVDQRRSDILIDENLDDFIDEEYQLSALNYLEKLKQNGSDLTIDSIVPLIPEIINDLRANKISDDDIATLSDAFGKYWKTVLHFANSTNLDMLPLLKMKDEKDLKNVLQSLALEKFVTTTEKIGSEINSHFYFDLYDYIEKYDDLFKEIQERKDHSINSMKRRI